jgi:hypothetical protein
MQAAQQRLPQEEVRQLQIEHANVKSDADVGVFAASVVKHLQRKQRQLQ